MFPSGLSQHNLMAPMLCVSRGGMLSLSGKKQKRGFEYKPDKYFSNNDSNNKIKNKIKIIIKCKNK